MRFSEFQGFGALAYLAIKLVMSASAEVFEEAKALAYASNHNDLCDLLLIPYDKRITDVNFNEAGLNAGVEEHHRSLRRIWDWWKRGRGKVYDEALTLNGDDISQDVLKLIKKMTQIAEETQNSAIQSKELYQTLFEELEMLRQDKTLEGLTEMIQMGEIFQGFGLLITCDYLYMLARRDTPALTNKNIIYSQLGSKLLRIEAAQITNKLMQAFLSLTKEVDVKPTKPLHRLLRLVVEVFQNVSPVKVSRGAGLLSDLRDTPLALESTGIVARKALESYVWRYYLGLWANSQDFFYPLGIKAYFFHERKLFHLKAISSSLGIEPTTQLAVKALQRYARVFQDKVARRDGPAKDLMPILNNLLKAPPDSSRKTVQVALEKALSDPQVPQLSEEESLVYHVLLFQVATLHSLFNDSHDSQSTKFDMLLFSLKEPLEVLTDYLELLEIMTRLKLIENSKDSQKHDFLALVDELKSDDLNYLASRFDAVPPRHMFWRAQDLYKQLNPVEWSPIKPKTSSFENTDQSLEALLPHNPPLRETGDSEMRTDSSEFSSSLPEQNLSKLKQYLWTTLNEIVPDIRKRWKLNEGQAFEM